MTRANRAIVYTQNGEPASVLRAITYPTLPPPPAGALTIRYLLAPVNPSDVNVVQGVYPAKPMPISLTPSGAGSADEPVFVGGNEGVAEVTAIGAGVEGLRKGDWVIMAKQQAGTWATQASVVPQDVIRVEKDTEGFRDVHAATLTVNPPTAWNMLRDFVDLKEGDWVLQNGANSAVGQSVVQLANHRGLKTINFVRNRKDIDALKKQLVELGATHVFTYDELSDKAFVEHVKELTGGKDIRLFLNCVGGKETAQMARLLGHDAHLVTYGAMSKQPLSLPASLFIFKSLTTHGFWQSRWYKKHSRAEREALVATLTKLIADSKLKEAECEIVTLPGSESDEQVTQRIRDLMEKMAEGYRKKVLFRIEETRESA